MPQVVTLDADIVRKFSTLIVEDDSVVMDERLDCILKVLVSRNWHHTIVTAHNICSRFSQRTMKQSDLAWTGVAELGNALSSLARWR